MAAPDDASAPQLQATKKIWDEAPHNAFTDLIRFKDQWFCTFRESAAHVGGNGKIRIIISADDADTWTSAALISEDGVDLRDPKLSITADGRLMLLMGGSIYEDKKLRGRQPRAAFSKDGVKWTAPQRILAEGDWLWRVTWHEGRAYGLAYRAADPKTDAPWYLTLYSSPDGANYEPIRELNLSGRPNEATIRFLPDGRMIALVRREANDQHGWIGLSSAPFTQWEWTDAKQRFGGPNFIVLDDGAMWAAGRDHTTPKPTMCLARLQIDTYKPELTFPSGGDCSYPGMVLHNGLLYVSYYSSHEGKTSIYLSKVKLPAK